MFIHTYVHVSEALFFPSPSFIHVEKNNYDLMAYTRHMYCSSTCQMGMIPKKGIEVISWTKSLTWHLSVFFTINLLGKDLKIYISEFAERCTMPE
jgi:hypothetical protein